MLSRMYYEILDKSVMFLGVSGAFRFRFGLTTDLK